MAADPRDDLVCASAAMRELSAAIDRIAAATQPVLIVGEPGSGRELVARLIHARSPRRRKPLVTVRAGAAPRALFVDELEGSSMDAFDRAAGGGLLIKDVGELSRMAQRKLARVLGGQAAGKGFDARVLATAEPGLERIAEAEMYNRVLHQRLSVWTLVVPPLRERLDDVAPLCERFLRQYCRELGRGKIALGERAVARLTGHGWPGNVAELKQVARRLAIGVRGRVAGEGDVDAVLPVAVTRVPVEGLSLEEMVRARLSDFLRRVEGYAVTGVHDDIMGQVERPLIALVLEHAGGNQVRAAEILGLSRNTLRKKLADHGIGERRRAGRSRS
jgi:two-component system, NtrC family, nitrogen regulation response regulator GlnG